jgi:hypothetical protein
MDVADDADGRVVIFAGDAELAGSMPERSPRAPDGRGGLGDATHLFGEMLDSRYGAAFIAAALVAVLVLGLLLTHH